MHASLLKQSKHIKVTRMRNLTATICVIFAVLLGSSGCQTTSPIPYFKSEVKGSDLPVCEGSPVKGTYKTVGLLGWNNCKGVLIWYGPFKGSYDWNGTKLIGEWKNGKAHGHFLNSYLHKNLKFATYDGEYKDNVRKGQGTFTFGPQSGRQGEKYVGEWRDNEKNGQGTYTFADGRVQEGIWQNGKFQYAQ
jgi:hypothetical protein